VETAFLYRDNESSVVLIDLLLRNNIPFRLRKPEMNFFGSRVVKEIVAYLSLALNENNADAFLQICNKGIIYLKNQQKDFAIRNCKYNRISIYEALEGQMKYLKGKQKERASDFHNIMKRVSKAKSSEAISLLMDNGYAKYLRDGHLDSGKVEILSILAKQEPDIPKFLNRLVELERLIQQGFCADDSTVILSTIHSSKGLEYDRVYMVDVYDGRFPSSRPNIFSRSKDNEDGEQEERRLFYVGITRAKNFLQLFSIKGRDSTFVDELFPEIKEIQPKEREIYRQRTSQQVTRSPSYSQSSYIKQHYSYDCPQAEVGMKILHSGYGELTIIEVTNLPEKTVIRVQYPNGETSSMTWNILWAKNMVKII
jgi:DNA helicase-2/ATP-dependent DNA helicase PcrA